LEAPGSVQAKARPIEAVLFDLDDTLLDSYGARIRALEIVFEQANISLEADRFLQGINGAQIKEAVDSLGKIHHVNDDLFIAYRRAYWTKKPGNVRLYPGIREVLTTLKSDGFKLGIVTNKGRDFEFEGRRVGCVYELREAGIDQLFSTIIGFEDVVEQKPHPEGILLALRRLGVQSEKALVVGDSPADIGAAAAAGCPSCRAMWGVIGTPGQPENLTAHYTIKSPGDLLELDCM
jgi:pyrophosphatase PpaX